MCPNFAIAFALEIKLAGCNNHAHEIIVFTSDSMLDASEHSIFLSALLWVASESLAGSALALDQPPSREKRDTHMSYGKNILV